MGIILIIIIIIIIIKPWARPNLNKFCRSVKEERNRALGRAERRWENNIKLVLK
jgi:hypothetical protein